MKFDSQIQVFIEAPRGEDGAQMFVYLPDCGVMVNLETCTSIPLVNAALAQLTAELDEVSCQLAKARLVEARLEGRR